MICNTVINCMHVGVPYKPGESGGALVGITAFVDDMVVDMVDTD